MKVKKFWIEILLLIVILLFVGISARGYMESRQEISGEETKNAVISVSGEEAQAEIEDNLPEDAPVLRVFDKNMDGQAFDDQVAEVIMEKTGVRIELVDATDNPNETLEAMLINGNYPDIILMEQGEMVNSFIESEVFIPLDDLIESEGENITEMYGDILDKSRYSDGKLYWLANWYGKDTDASACVLMRKDYLIDLVGEERANSNEPFTLTEYTTLLRRFRQLHPTIDNETVISLDLDSDADNYEMTLKGIFGMKTYGLDEDGNLEYLPATERYKEALLYLNELYRENIICKQWVIDRSEKWEKDLLSGQVFSTWGSYWDTDSVNAILKAEYGEDAQFFAYKVVADDLTAEQTTYNGRNSLGWDAIGITDNCENTRAAMKVLNYLASEEGQYLLLWGPEGETWDMVDGKHVPREDFLEQWQADSDQTETESGVRRWKWVIKNGNGADGTPYDLTTKYLPSDTVSFANASIDDSDYWDTAEYSGLEPSVKSNLGLKWQKIEDLYDQYYAQIICANSAEEAEVLYEKMLSDMEIAGLSECEEYITAQYHKRMKVWD